MLKKCTKCGLEKKLSEFYKSPVNKDGYTYECKKCRKKIHAIWSIKNRNRNKKYCRVYYLKHTKEILYRNQSYLKNNKEKQFAHLKVFRAIKSGKLKKQPCYICAEKAEAHHNDYLKPLDVQWVCSLHHKQIHKRHPELINI